MLSCEDAGTPGASGGPGAGDFEFRGATFERLRTQLENVPRAADVGLTVPPTMADWHFRKVPVYLSAGAPPVTVRLHDSGGNSTLAWVSSDAWTSGSSPVLAEWLASSVTFEGCRDRPSVYFGGLAASSPGTCLSPTFEAGTLRESASQRLDGATCT